MKKYDEKELPRIEVCDELEFFKNAEGEICFNAKCEECIHPCKQSFRAKIIRCKKRKKHPKNEM